jgi:hypothetical protein
MTISSEISLELIFVKAKGDFKMTRICYIIMKNISKIVSFLQGSRWTFQATRMNGDTFGWQILPDQMQVTSQLKILPCKCIEIIQYLFLFKIVAKHQDTGT